MANKNPKSASPISRTRSHQSLTVNKLESLLVEPPVITKGFSEIELVNTSTMDFLRCPNYHHAALKRFLLFTENVVLEFSRNQLLPGAQHKGAKCQFKTAGLYALSILSLRTISGICFLKKSTLKVANSKISPVHNSIRVRLIISLSQHWLPISYS
jgi:hypothetical protein